MTAKNCATALIISLLICAFASSCRGDGITEPTQTSIPATATPLPTEPPVPTSTETPFPTSTPILTPTPVQGQFLNRPAYLQEIFTGDYWITKDLSEGSLTMLSVKLPIETTSSNRFTIAYGTDPETADFIIFRTDLDMDLDLETRAELEVRIKNLFDSILKKFLPSPARDDLWMFTKGHPDPGTYQSRIYGFDINLMIEDDTEDNQHQMFLQINETVE